MKKENIKKGIAVTMIFCSILIGIYHYYTNEHKQELEDKSVNVFLDDVIKKREVDKKGKKSKTKEVINYIAVLEIPKINLKRGLVDPNSSSNNVGENIEILNPTSMPDSDNHTFMLAAHSGTSKVAYFNDLDKLSNGDFVYVYYKNKKYTYKIAAHYTEKKTGTITVQKEGEESIIVLTSCSRNNTKQLVYIGTLEDEEDYNA